MSGSTEKLKILALHGYRQSDVIFKGKLGSLRKSFKQKVDFVFARAPHEVPPLESNPDPEAADERGWWFNTEDREFVATQPSNLSVGFEESLATVKKIFQEEGPFDGVLGFSQGASFVSVLCALQQRQEPAIKFKFAILISGFKSLCAPHAQYYLEKINIPSLHVCGESDKIIPIEMEKELADLFTDHKLILHEGGHFVPGKKHIYNDFFNEMYVCNSAKTATQ